MSLVQPSPLTWCPCKADYVKWNLVAVLSLSDVKVTSWYQKILLSLLSVVVAMLLWHYYTLLVLYTSAIPYLQTRLCYSADINNNTVSHDSKTVLNIKTLMRTTKQKLDFWILKIQHFTKQQPIRDIFL